MHLITVVDDRNGMMFHNRRQSRDRVLYEKIISITDASLLWINHYSEPLFEEYKITNCLCIDDCFLNKAAANEFCFVENILPDAACIDDIILFKWNRSYPGDFFFDIDMSPWILKRTEDFAGFSHEKITMEVYSRAKQEIQ